MNQTVDTNEYNTLAKSIKRKRRLIIVLTFIVVFITIAVCSPATVEIMEESVFEYKGVSPIITVSIIIVILLCELFAYAYVSVPLSTSMDKEVNPQKHLILNSTLNTKNLNFIIVTDSLYMGDFKAALEYVTPSLYHKNPSIVNAALFNKARCEFFLGDYTSLKSTAEQYELSLSNINMNAKAKEVCGKMQKIVKLLVALAENDKEKIAEYHGIDSWNDSKATEGYVNYLKGLSAYKLNDNDEAIYRLMYVKEHCQLTIFAQLAEQHLSNLKCEKEAQTNE